MRGYCERRKAYVPRPLWRMCQAGKCERVDSLVADLAKKIDYGPHKKKPSRRANPNYNHWEPLHKYAVSRADKWNPKAARRWYQVWVARIPNRRSCNCKGKWLALGLEPDFSTAEAFFEWTWLAHDTVSVELGNKRISLDECYSIWWQDCKSVRIAQ